MSVPSGIVSFVSRRISAISLRVSGNKTNYFFRDQTLSDYTLLQLMWSLNTKAYNYAVLSL
jgi:hypothetical protein